MRHILLCLTLLAVAAAYPASSSAAPDVVEQQMPLPVNIDGHDERLEALIVRPAAGGRYPVALIVNGAFPTPKDSHPAGLAGGVWHDAKPFEPAPACGRFEDELVCLVGG